MQYSSPAAFPPQQVRVSPVEVGVVTAGGRYALECDISRVATLSNATLLEVMWFSPDNDIITSGTAYSITGTTSTNATSLTSTLTFPRLTTSQGGVYTCAVNMTIPGIVTDHQVLRQENVRVASESGQPTPSISPSLYVPLSHPYFLPLPSPPPHSFPCHLSLLATRQRGHSLCGHTTGVGVHSHSGQDTSGY